MNKSSFVIGDGSETKCPNKDDISMFYKVPRQKQAFTMLN